MDRETTEFVESVLSGLTEHEMNMAGLRVRRQVREENRNIRDRKKELEHRKRALAFRIREHDLSPVEERNLHQTVAELKDEETQLAWQQENAEERREKFGKYALGRPPKTIELVRRN